MNKKSCKIRIQSALLALLLLLPAGNLTACNQEKNPDASNPPKKAEPVAVDHVWKTDYITLPDGINVWEIKNPVYDENRLSFSANRIIDEENWTREPVTLTYDFTSGEISCAAAPNPDSDQFGYSQATQPMQDGGTISLFQSYDRTTGDSTWNLVRFSADASVIWNIDVLSQFKELENAQWAYISDLYCTPDGTIYTIAEKNVLAISAEGTRLFEIKMDTYIDNTFVSSDGVLYISYYDFNQANGTGGCVYRAIDKEKQALGDVLPIPENVNLDNSRIFMADGYDLFFINDTGLFALNYTDTEATQLCNWVNSDIVGSDIRYQFQLLSADRAVFLDENPVSGNMQLCVMTPMAPEDVKPKYLIEVAYVERGMNTLQNYAVAFNRQSEDYRVVLHNYSDDANENQSAAEVLNQDILSGRIPDIIMADSYSFDVDSLIDKGLFLDLYSYMDAENAKMTRSDFLPCVLAPFEDKNGALPFLVSGFVLQTLFAHTSVVGNRSVWSFDDILALSDSLAEDQYLLTMYMDDTPQAAQNAKMQLMELLLSYSLPAFIDEKNASCSFTDGRFAALLSFCDTCPTMNPADYNYDTTELFQNGKLVLSSNTGLYGISDYLKTKYYDFGGKDMTVIGYPTADESAKSGTIIEARTKYGITKDSPVADGAWEFIISTFGDLGQNVYYHHDGFPSARAALDAMFESEARNYYVFHQNGWSCSSLSPEESEVDEEKMLKEDEWLREEIANGGVFGHLTDADRQEINAILENVTIAAGKQTDILDLIREDVSAYFAGMKTLEDTVTVIQSRVSIYVSEKMG